LSRGRSAASIASSLAALIKEAQVGVGYVINPIYPLVNICITMENHHFQWENHYKWPFSIAMLNYQRVSPENSQNVCSV
jgi:hypothetical protein